MALTLSLLALAFLIWLGQRERKYPLARGLRRFVLLTYPLPLVRKPLIRLANAVIRRLPQGKCIEGVAVSRQMVGSVPVTVFTPVNGDSGRTLVYFHGGGFFLEAAPYLGRKCARYARGAGCTVISVDYRTSDRAPWPAQLDDAATVLSQLAGKGGRIAIGGDSAGGFIARELALWAKEKKIGICFLMLVYPVLDPTMSSLSMASFTDTPVWNARLTRRMWSLLCPDGTQGLSTSLVQVPTYIEAAEYDCLRDEALDYAMRLENAEVHLVHGACHGYDVAERSNLARSMIEHRIEALARAFSVCTRGQ